MVIMLKVLGILKNFGKKKIQAKIRKKARRRLRRFTRKVFGLAFAGFCAFMLVKHRRPILAAIIGKEQPTGKCPVFRKG